MTPGLHPGYQQNTVDLGYRQFKSAPTHYSKTICELPTMSGDLLHLIRDAEKKSEKIISDATLEAQRIIEEARSEAKKILTQAKSKKTDNNTDRLKITRKEYQAKIQELETQLKKQKAKSEKQASSNTEKAIDFVVSSILED